MVNSREQIQRIAEPDGLHWKTANCCQQSQPLGTNGRVRKSDTGNSPRYFQSEKENLKNELFREALCSMQNVGLAYGHFSCFTHTDIHAEMPVQYTGIRPSSSGACIQVLGLAPRHDLTGAGGL